MEAHGKSGPHVILWSNRMFVRKVDTPMGEGYMKGGTAHICVAKDFQEIFLFIFSTAFARMCSEALVRKLFTFRSENETEVD